MKKTKKKKNYMISLLKIFFGVLLGILFAGGIAVVSIYLIKGVPTAAEKKTEKAKVVEVFPQIPQKTKQEETKVPQGKYGGVLANPQKMQEENIYAKEGKEKGEVTLAFGGDILLDPNYAIMAALIRNGIEIQNGIAPPLLKKMREVDVCMLNNEFPYSLRGEPTLEKQFTFRAKPEYASLLTEMGVDIVSLANNHAYDYGESALLDTFDALQQEGIPYVGAGRNVAEASKPVYYIINDIKIAIVSATQIERLDNPDTKEATETEAGVFRCWNPERLCAQIEEAEKNSDFVILYVHWGTENEEKIDWAQQEQAPMYVEAGADLIIGDHPHCLQKTEYIGKVPIIYSVGNFWFNSKSLDTVLARITITKDGLQTYELLPCKQEKCVTSLLEGAEKQRVISYLNAISPDVLIDADGKVQKKQ